MMNALNGAGALLGCLSDEAAQLHLSGVKDAAKLVSEALPFLQPLLSRSSPRSPKERLLLSKITDSS
jgi:hypothetical protein